MPKRWHHRRLWVGGLLSRPPCCARRSWPEALAVRIARPPSPRSWPTAPWRGLDRARGSERRCGCGRRQRLPPHGSRYSSQRPYLLDGSISVVDPLGVAVTANAPVRLCRCGQSQTKPFCDNSHIERGFTDDKNPRRVIDKFDVHEGQQAYVFDNRGFMAHRVRLYHRA
jgi:CDGSH-type Zn-finger protein